MHVHAFVSIFEAVARCSRMNIMYEHYIIWSHCQYCIFNFLLSVVTICGCLHVVGRNTSTTFYSLTLNGYFYVPTSSAFRNCAFICLACFSEQTEIVSLYSINKLVSL